MRKDPKLPMNIPSRCCGQASRSTRSSRGTSPAITQGMEICSLLFHMQPPTFQQEGCQSQSRRMSAGASKNNTDSRDAAISAAHARTPLHTHKPTRLFGSFPIAVSCLWLVPSSQSGLRFVSHLIASSSSLQHCSANAHAKYRDCLSDCAHITHCAARVADRFDTQLPMRPTILTFRIFR
ncbi:hypothetical protein BCR34DRAFT_370403 [Clohesyomyces aquaticus]|uniref:Uncharacterized protein n=1 Tax=Clohesyomyces aquaticus TaxID=1231657 RepID=A0A1Y1ZGZ4_9PLEO|nr:hypothetical protein BCR34DRAFT_370403 [Clohesyomyces aquaticus]